MQRLEESHWDATLFFFFLDRIGDAKPLEGMKRVKEQFFPLFPEEILLLERLALLFESMGEEGEAADCFRIARELAEALQREPPKGADLLIGGVEKYDTIFPQKAMSRAEKPLFIREIEQRFSLDVMVYRDADIEAFFAALPIEDETKILQFFVELREKKQISQEQLKSVARRFCIDME